MTKYIATAVRSHSTRTKKIDFGREFMEVPFRDTLKVSVDLPLKEIAIAALPPAEEGWEPWEVQKIVEEYSFLLPELVVPDATLAGKMWRVSAREHPFLYGNDVFTPFRIFMHWFFTIGNGCEWSEEGALYDNCALPENLTNVEFERHLDKVLAEPVPAEYAEEVVKFDEYADEVFGDLWAPVHMYPPSFDYAAIFNMPDNAEPSFVLAAANLCQYMLSRPVWENYAYKPKEMKIPEELEAEGYIASGAESRAYIKEAFAKLILGKHRKYLEEAGVPDKHIPMDCRRPPLVIKF